MYIYNIMYIIYVYIYIYIYIYIAFVRNTVYCMKHKLFVQYIITHII